MLSAATGNLDRVRLCEPECRNAFLLDLGVPHRGRGGWTFRSYGEADVTVAWNSIRFHVTWKRGRPTARACDQCGDEWMYRIPELIARAEERSAALKGIAPAGSTPFPSLGAVASASG